MPNLPLFKRFLSCGLLCLWTGVAVLVPFSAQAFPEILNPSFELDGDGVLWPGVHPITNWVTVGNVGINPLRQEYAVLESQVPNFRNAFANNGKPAEGTRVLYIQSSQNSDLPAQIRQDISGFEPGKTYVLRYFENRRINVGDIAQVWITLGGQTIVPLHQVTRYADPPGVYNNPYPRVISRPFTTNSAGPHTLNVLMQCGQPANAQGLPKEVHDHRRNEGSVLLDYFQFIELGDLDIVSARRSFIDHKKVTVVFSKNLLAANAVLPNNYFITNTSFGTVLRIVRAELGADQKTVTLTTEDNLEDDYTYTLATEDVLDTSNKGIMPLNNAEPVLLTKIFPGDFSGSPVPAFQDDFAGALRSPDWKPFGPGGDVYRQHYGVLQVGTAQSGPNHLLYQPQTAYNQTQQEILAKIRTVELDPTGGSGGIAAGTAAPSSQGVNFLFQQQSGPVTAFRQDGAAPLPSLPLTWQNQKWFWIRLKYQPGGSTGDALARIWPADFDAVEPNVWESFRFPAGTTPLSGLAGITAGSDGKQSRFEVDYILIKAEGLPLIQPTAPEPSAPALSLTTAADKLVLTWPAQDAGFALEENIDVGNPQTWSLTLGEESTDGINHSITVPMPSQPTFYRLRGL